MKERIITGIVMAIIFLIPFYVGEDWFTYFTILMAAIAYYETARLIGIKQFGLKWFVGLASILFLFTPLLHMETEHMQTKVLLAIVLFFITSTVFQEGFSFEKAGSLLIGLLYVGFGFYGMAEARIENGMMWTLTILLTIWMTDACAYFVGRKIGKRKLAPKISPNKTIEGSLGGVIFALVLGVGFQLAASPYENMITAICITLLVAIAGQIGDLVESALKRYYNVKDSGKLLPGHGGVLDRTDSWIFVFIGLKLFGLI